MYSALVALFSASFFFFVGEQSGDDPVMRFSRILPLEFALEFEYQFDVSFLPIEELELVSEESFEASLDWNDWLPMGDLELMPVPVALAVEIFESCTWGPVGEYSEYGEFIVKTGEGPSSKVGLDDITGVLKEL